MMRLGLACLSAPRFQVARGIPGCFHYLESSYVVAHSGLNDHVSKLWCNLESAFTVPSSRSPAGRAQKHKDTCTSRTPHLGAIFERNTRPDGFVAMLSRRRHTMSIR
jgi:hypothetical protein